MIDKLRTIIDALNELQIEALQKRSTDDRFFWLDFYYEEARVKLKTALRHLEENS